MVSKKQTESGSDRGQAAGKPSRTRKPSRLGRGLSSLMAGPVGIDVSNGAMKEGVSGAEVSPQDGEASAVAGGDASQAEAGKSSRPGVASESALAAAPIVSEEGAAPVGSLVGALGMEASDRVVVDLPISAVKVNPYQPRQRFDDTALRQLAESIRQDGLIQPIVVRPMAPEDGEKKGPSLYELVAGERRWRAAEMAGLTTLPAIVHHLDDRQAAEWSLIENLQRQDLNPIERAEAFEKLAQQFNLSHAQIAQRVGVDRSTITNTLRLLQLADEVKTLVSDGLLSAGQARAIVAVADAQQQLRLAQQAITKAMSVRQVERVVAQAVRVTQDNPPSTVAARGSSTHLERLESHVSEQLGAKVKIRQGRRKGAGSMTIEFYSIEQFDFLLGRLGVSTDY